MLTLCSTPRCFTRFLNTASAIGERQMFPVFKTKQNMDAKSVVGDNVLMLQLYQCCNSKELFKQYQGNTTITGIKPLSLKHKMLYLSI